jgi:dolichyl-phosphate beta-glucosyltransferase
MNPSPEPARESLAPRVSVVTPCYDGAGFISESLGRLCEYLRTHESEIGPAEVIFVDDGSRDRTVEVVSSSFPEIRLIRHERNRGKGAAVRTGMLAASGDFVFFIDADIPYDLSALPRMLDYLDRKEFHICIGTRSRLPDSHPALRRRSRRIASWLFTQLVSRIVITGVKDTQAGFKGFRRDVARYLFGNTRCENFAFDVEVLYLAYKNDLDVKKVPVRLCADDASSISLLRHGLPMLLELPKLPFRYDRGRYQPMREGGGEDASWGA